MKLHARYNIFCLFLRNFYIYILRMSGVQRTLTAAKQALRKELKQKLKSMSNDEKTTESRIITDKLVSLDVFKSCRSLSLYMSMPTEVSTYAVMDHVFSSQKRLYIPHYHGDKMKMVLLRDQQDFDSLPVTSWNIKQPADDDLRQCAMDGEGLDIIVVPGLGFTRGGLRLGRGRGYYDNYFRQYELKFGNKPYLIGLAYSNQVLDDLPADEFDVKLDCLLYP